MLKARILTAAVLLSVFFFALFALPPVGWAGFVTLIAALAAWEWGGLMRLDSGARVASGVVVCALCALLVFAFPSPTGLENEFPAAARHFGFYFYLPAFVFWFACVPVWLTRRWPLKPPALGAATGLLLILPTWLALIQLKRLGAWPLLAVMAIVWLADTGGYFFGRSFGRHKLAPSISPGKTWEGVAGGVFAVVVYGFCVRAAFPELFPELSAVSPLSFFLALVFLSLFSVVGDLFESMLKRQADVKDSSGLLPGHGGILDRIDSLTSVLPLVALLCSTVLPR
ncbi:MAG: phosphatidate cytidylyltransferase [Candidatus Accumulibacter sp.]|jgi:phosphatidate cytidylyltransferase|nr:phosphatidate cytidylyltransferase [Accumulibacter sp.]